MRGDLAGTPDRLSMQVRVFTLRFNPATEAFEESAVSQFLADKEVCSIHDHFFVKDDTPYLTLVVCYRPSALPPPRPDAQGAGRQRDESWRESLAKEDWPLFNRLREWRAERAKADGVPPYVISNNRQLAEVVKVRPDTLAALGAIEGFGAAKLKKYGKDLLALIAGAGPRSPPEIEGGNDGAPG
jgi:superfamily II DNA helicase RecQ